MGLPVCTRQLWPRPTIFPRWTKTAPMGMPPSHRLLRACSMAAWRNGSFSMGGSLSSAQQILQLEASIGVGVAVFDDDGSIEGNAPVLAGAVRHGARAGDDHGIFGNYEGMAVGGFIYLAADQIVDRGGARQDGSAAQDSAALHDGSLVDAAIAAHHGFVFDDDRQGADGLQDAADLGGGGNMTVGADLSAASHQGVRIDDGSLADPGS